MILQASPSQGADPVRASFHYLVQLQARARTLSLSRSSFRSAKRQGGHRTTVRGRGMSLAEVRPYHPGDDIRHIDWRVSARTQSTHTKIYEEERECPVLILCDLGPSTFFASQGAYKQVRGAETSALLAWLALGSGDQVGGVVFNHLSAEVIRPARRKKTLLHLLAALEQHQHAQAPSVDELEQADNRLDHALTEARRIARTGSRIFIISDFSSVTEATTGHLGNLARHHAVTAIELADPLDSQPPVAGQYAVETAAGTLWFDSREPGFAQAWRDQARARQASLSRLFMDTATDHLTLMTGDEPESVVSLLVGPGGRLR